MAKVMVITGASSGVGEALARRFSGNGYTVCGIARSRGKLEAMAEELPAFEPHPADVSDAAGLKRVFHAIGEAHGNRIDVLINNAGFTGLDGNPLEGDIEAIDPLIDVNLKGVMYCTFLALPMMAPHQSGYIINVSSIAAIPTDLPPRSRKEKEIPCPAYGVAKAGVNQFGAVIGKALLENGIRLTTLCPGGIATPLWLEKNDYPGDVNRLMKPQEVVDLIDLLLRQPEGTLYRSVVFFPTNEWR